MFAAKKKIFKSHFKVNNFKTEHYLYLITEIDLLNFKLKIILYFTNIFPSYRKELWKNLLGSPKMEFHIFFSNQNLNGIGTTKVDSIFSKAEKQKMHQIQNYLIGRHLWWQKGVLKALWSSNFNTAIFLGDMKILSN